MRKAKKEITIIVILFSLAILYFYKLGSIGFIDVDEPRYAEASREILESGNWIVPFFNYVERFDKPILFYWLGAISMKIFGVNEFAARLPSTLSALLCIAFVFYLLNTLFSLRTALFGSAILMTCFEFAALSRFSVTDMALTTFITCSLISFFLGYHRLLFSHRFFKMQISEISLWYIVGFIFLGLAFLTKGPVALILLGIILVPFFWWVGKMDYFFKSSSFYIGFVLFLMIVLPWYLSVHFATDGEFTKIFFGLHNFSRYTDIVSGHKGSFFYFVPVLLIGFLPWTFFLPQAINFVTKKGLKSLLGSTKAQLPWFCLWWSIVVFLFFSFSKTKLLTYILPIFPALSIIVALWFEELLTKQSINYGLITGLVIFFLFCIVMLCICLFNLDLILPREVKDLKLDLQILFFGFLMFVGISMALASSHRDMMMTLSIILTTFTLLYFCLITSLLPKVDKHAQLALRNFAKSMPNNIEIATYQIVKPSLTFYAKRHVKKISSLERLQERLNSERKIAFVTKKQLLRGIMLDNFYFLGSDSRYVFFTNYPAE